MLSVRQYELAHAVARGEGHVEAYMRIYGVSRSHAARHAAQALRQEGVQELLHELQAADRTVTEDVRRELVAALLEDSRNERLAARDRLAARAQLARLFGLEAAQRVEVSADEGFREALLRGAQEPLVRDEG